MNVNEEADETTRLLSPEIQARRQSASSQHDHELDSDVEVNAGVIWTAIPIAIIGVFVANIDASLIIAASQRIASEFEALDSASWVVTSYALAQCASQPLYGKLSTIFGRRNNLVWCYFFFALGNLICGIGREYWQVIVGRVLSGAGGAGMAALVSLIIADLVPVRNIAAWRSFVNLAATLGRSLGGPVGGWLTDTVGWRKAFLGQVPLTIAGLILLMWKLPGTIGQTKTPEYQSTTKQKLKRIDVPGAISLSVTITSFLLTLDLASKHMPVYYPIITGIITSIAGCTFYVVERYYAKEPILPLELITKRVAWTTYLLVGFQLAAQGTTFYSTPIYFQIVAAFSVRDAGLRLVPAVVGNAIGGILSGIIISRTGRYKYLTVFASAVATTGYTLVLIRWTGTVSWWETQYIFLGGFGMGIVISTTFVHLAANLNQEDLAIAGTNLYLSTYVFGVLGIQVATTILHATLLPALNRDLSFLPNKKEIIADVTSNINSISTLPDTIRTIVRQAYIHSLRYTYAAFVAFAVIGLLLGISMKEGTIQ